MYVVRLSLPENEPKFKVFTTLPDAKKYFDAGCAVVYNSYGEEVVGAALFDVPVETDVWKAVQAVKNGQAVILDTDIWGDLQKAFDELIDKEIQVGKLEVKL